MNLLGVSIKVRVDKVEIEVSRNEIIKITEKQYKMKSGYDLIFNCLSNVPKDAIGKIQAGSFGGDYVDSFERKMWVLDDGITEQSIIETLKSEVRKELERRNIMCIKMMSNINDLKEKN